jgi:protease IV
MLSLFVRLVRFGFALLLLPWRRFRRARAVPQGAYLTLDIDGAVVDVAEPRPLWKRLVRSSRPRPVVLHDLAELIDAMRTDARVRGLVVTIKSLGAGMATATSLRALLLRLRAANKDVVVHLPLGGDTKELYVASAASKIFVGPQATLAPLGFATSVRYVKGALAKAGLVPQVVARGEYKSAGEQLVRDSMSDAQREQLEAIQEVFYAQLLLAIGEGRKVNRETARAIVDGAPYRAEKAIEVGLVDGTAYEDELPGKLDEGGARVTLVPALRYLARVRSARLPKLRLGAVVGVIPVHGAISSQGPTGFGGGATDEALISMVRAARANRRVKSVVLHVDSPGGSALASDRIHHEIEQLAKEKPVVACFANVAASGGYYVAAPAHEIVAQPTTITGSIGVVAARVVLEPLLKRVGIVTETVKRGERADMLDPARPFTDDERGALERDLDGMYRAFVSIVARGRDQTVEAIEKVAEGRVWSGAAASGKRLVDTLGGFEEALASAQRRAGDELGKLAPMVLTAPRGAIPPLDPPAQAARMALGALGIDTSLLAFGGARDRVLVWCELATWIR